MWMVLLAACGAGKGAGGVADPTWEADVSPIVQRSCAGCHHTGGVGSGDLTTYASAAPLASAIAAYTSAGLMPPPAMDPSCRSYVGHERMVLTDAEIETTSRVVKDLMQNPPAEVALSVPLVADVGHGPSWAAAKG